MAIVRCWMADLHDRMVWLCLELCQARKPLIASAVSASMSARSRGFRECGTVDGGGGGGIHIFAADDAGAYAHPSVCAATSSSFESSLMYFVTSVGVNPAVGLINGCWTHALRGHAQRVPQGQSSKRAQCAPFGSGHCCASLRSRCDGPFNLSVDGLRNF